MKVTIAAFGALNAASYEEFAAQMQARARGFPYELFSAGPYPNAKAVSEPGRPLRAEALQDEAKKLELFVAVADDATKVGALWTNIRVMTCMSMIGFHEGVEMVLGKSILRLADALAKKYTHVDKVGVIHMRPAKNRIEEIFGAKAVTPDEAQAEKLLAAEEEGKRLKSAVPVKAVMKDITESWRDQGLKHVLFARADAPKAIHSAAGKVSGVEIHSYFDILADAVLLEARKRPS